MTSLLEKFDLEQYLESRGLEYRTEGKNVTEGWVNIACLWCDDPSFHLGICVTDLDNYSDGGYHCWRCGEKGTAIQLVQKLEGGISAAQAGTIISEFYTDKKEVSKKRVTGSTTFYLPPEAKPLSKIHRKYLIQRRYDPDYIIETYKVLGTGHLGRDKFRLIIPIIMNRRVVNYTGRDISGKQEIKYKNCPNEKAIIPIRDCIYNIDNVSGKMLIVVEGVFDVWRLGGDGVVAVLGTEFTMAQVNRLRKKCRKKEIEKVVILFDSEIHAQRKAMELGEFLNPFLPTTVEVVVLESGDPDSLTDKEARELMELLKDPPKKGL